MKKSILVMLCVVLLCGLFLGGCGTAAQKIPSTEPSNTNKGSAQKQHIFGLTLQTLDNQHWLRWQEGIQSVLDTKGDKLIVLDAQYDSAKQISQVEDLIVQKCDAIFIVAVDGKAIKSALVKCQDAKIPVIACDIAPDDKSLATAIVATDNYLAGKLLGEAMVKESGGQAKVGVVGYDVIDSCRKRVEGFTDAIKSSPNIKVVIRQDAAPSTEAVLPVIENMLQSNPEITDIYCINDLGSFAAVQACKAAKRPEIRIYGVDGNPIAARMALSGEMIGTSAQFPDRMGKKAAEVAYQIIAGNKFEVETLVAADWINKTNAQAYLDALGKWGIETKK